MSDQTTTKPTIEVLHGAPAQTPIGSPEAAIVTEAMRPPRPTETPADIGAQLAAMRKRIRERQDEIRAHNKKVEEQKTII